MARIEAEVCVVGSGVAGAIVAQECLDAGRSVVMLEAGKRANGRALGLRAMEHLVRDYRIPRVKFWHRRARYRNSDYTGVGYSLAGRALVIGGGSTLGWSGDAYRMKPEDFKLATNTGIGLNWPISYEDLEPHYTKAEATIRVAGAHSDIGHPPRREPFPISPRPFHDRDERFLGLLASHGWPPMYHNISLSPDGGVFTADELLDRLEGRRQFSLLVGTVATRIVLASRERAAAIECWNPSRGQALTVEAERLVLCGGGIETPNLLLRSVNRWWRQGLGNHSGHVGRHLISHGGVAIGGRPKGIRPFYGPIAPTAASRHFDTEEFQRDGKYLFVWRPAPSGLLFLNANFEQFPNEANTVIPGSGMTRFGTPKPVITMELDQRHRNREAAIQAQLEAFASEMALTIRFRRKYTLAHPMCTTRMSREPSEGVLDANMRVHLMNNLYVCGSAAFSSGGAANPTMTIAALAHRLGAHVAQTAPGGGNRN